MRHRVETKNLGRSSSYRAATIKSIIISVLRYQRIKTTRTRAKLVQRELEHLISLAKEGSLHSKRLAYRELCDHLLVKYLFDEVGKLFKNRSSGFTRVIHLERRRGDDAQIVILELTEQKQKKEKKPKKEEPKKEAKIRQTEDQKLTEKEGPEEQKEVKEERPVVKEKSAPAVHERPGKEKKPPKKFLGGLRTLFKKERDSLE